MNRALSFLPVRAHLNTNMYENERLLQVPFQVPSDNTGVNVAGNLESVETDSAGHAIMFHVSVDVINSFGTIT